MNEVLRLGYTEPEVYFARCEAHYFHHDYGMALLDIERAISEGKDRLDIEECLHWKKTILTRIEAADAVPN